MNTAIVLITVTSKYGYLLLDTTHILSKNIFVDFKIEDGSRNVEVGNDDPDEVDLDTPTWMKDFNHNSHLHHLSLIHI